MGLEEVKKEILDKAKEESARIEAEATMQIKSMEDDFANEMKEKRMLSKARIDEEIKHLTEIKEAEAKALARDITAEKKMQIINQAIAKAKQKLKEKNKEYIPKMIEKAKKEFSFSIGKIYCNKEDMHLIKGAIEADIDGGIIIENLDGDVSIDYSYDTLLESIKNRYIQEIAKALFP